MKVVFCTPFLTRPTEFYLNALEQSVPVLDAAGIEHYLTVEIGNPYISGARSLMTRRALDAKADVIMYIDYDLSWEPADLLKLIEMPGDVVSGTYRFKQDKEEYMDIPMTDSVGRPLVRKDGCVEARCVPGGFLKVTKEAIEKFMTAYPELIYGFKYYPYIDLFNHGAHNGVWYGEDYAFSRNWRNCGGKLWIVPDLNITHHTKEKAYPGNYHQYLMNLPKPKEAA